MSSKGKGTRREDDEAILQIDKFYGMVFKRNGYSMEIEL